MRKTGNTLSYNKTPPPKKESGSFNMNMPTLLKYPHISLLDKDTPLRDIFCYIIKGYSLSGISVLINRDPKIDQTGVIFGDWDGNILDLKSDGDLIRTCKSFAENHLSKLVAVMQLIGIEQAQYYFSTSSEKIILCDMQLSANKMAGPGMIRDIFGRTFDTQEVIKTEILDERAISAILQGNGSYEGDIIIKPSKYRLKESNDKNCFIPLYERVVR